MENQVAIGLLSSVQVSPKPLRFLCPWLIYVRMNHDINEDTPTPAYGVNNLNFKFHSTECLPGLEITLIQ